MPTTLISANRFWNLYFRNALLTLERRSDSYTGQIYNEPEHAQPPIGLLRDLVQVPVEVAFSVLREYDYSGDGRFALIAKRPADLNAAYEAIIKQTYPYRDRAPFGKQRMAELFTMLRLQSGHGTRSLSLAILQQMTLNMVENHTDTLNQPLAALAWFLGELRERSSSKALLAIIDNASFVPFARHRVHFAAVDAALTALWKVNDKASLWHMLELMRNTTDAGRRKITPLFQQLLSTTELLSIERCGDDYFRPEFWARMLEPRRTFTPTDWDHYDANSLFWEIRYLAALRLPSNSIDMFRKLANDEVQTVRDAVRSRLRRSSS